MAADAVIQLPPQIRRGDVIEVRALARHPMHSGYRVDDLGKPIPRHIVERFECRLDGTLMFEATMHPGIATNPYLAFHVRVERGGVLECRWVDDRGGVITATATMALANPGA
jgi:sulfur-oxidizing protein SoxZ